jgi:hypothetical protein
MSAAIRKLARAASDVASSATGTAAELAKEVGDALKKSKGIIDEDVAKILKKEGALEQFGAIMRRAGQLDLPKNAVKKNLNEVSDLTKNMSNKQLAKSIGSTVAETAEALKESDTFFKKNKTALIAAGVSAVGLAAYMLLTGETNPAKAVGKLLGGGVKGLLDGSGLGDLFKEWGTYIFAFFAVVLGMFGLYMFFG